VNTSGNYFVNITTSDGCTGVSDSVNITVVPDIVMPQIVSNGLGWVTSGATNSFTIVADSNYSYQWGVSQGAFILNGQGTDSINVFWGPADSNITIWLIASNGVCSDSVRELQLLSVVLELIRMKWVHYNSIRIQTVEDSLLMSMKNILALRTE